MDLNLNLLNFIGGAFVASESAKTFIKKSPFDGSDLSSVAQSDAMDVIKAIQGSKKALQQIENQTADDRAQLLADFANHLETHADRYACLEALHQGLPKSFVLENSIKVAISHLRYNSQNLSQSLLVTQDGHLQPRPVGIVGIITPWSLSLRLVMERMAPALAAGNVVILKVSELSPVTGQIIGEALQAIQALPGLVQIIQGGSDVAQIIAGHPSIRAVTAVGRGSSMAAIAKAGLAEFKKLQLSGGAKNSSIVLSDFDFKGRMSEVMKPFLLGQGQMCWNSSRLFVLESFQKEFMEALHTYMETLTPLSSPDGESVWTPLIAEDRMAMISERTQFGISEHGKSFWGIKPNEKRLDHPGFFVKPTVMIDLPNCSVMQQDELHGPLILVTPVKYQHETFKWANTSYLGHSGIVWGPEEKVQKVASKLECARVWENSWLSGQDGVLSNIIFGHKQSSFGNIDMAWNGSFYSDVKKLTGF
ncbi:aldehyde dehydrogenase family protein [Bdellovibrio svalbardensis]|uniref:Aldehyde dehydrogenase family protein n=1 Tax=Bdellovibrio svalbardensis TaxID=2972972 RepID=A0ABT6DKD7_9BACT|nr:aldehyde dehydrogenase family protein [Bdellovibrio svalbardensis]MDG0816977.1 aldehyde dehydrogenase family protein [Bdellovibrio svalbardensis]